MKASTLLRKVRDDMRDPHGYVSVYICDNVRARGSKTPKAYAAAERVCTHITILLGGLFSLREWLVVHGHVEDADPWNHKKHRNYHGRIDTDKLQATRIAWLGDLINHFETQGD